MIYTIREVASKLQVGHMLVWRLIRKGELRSIRVGRLHRIEEQALQEYLTSKRRLSQTA